MGEPDSLLARLIEALRCLPGVGPKSAQRMALHLLERDREGGQALSSVLADAMERPAGGEEPATAPAAAGGTIAL